MHLDRMIEYFVQNLIARRNSVGMTQKRLAEEMTRRGINWFPQTAARVEQFQRHLKLDEAIEIADILQTPLATMLRDPFNDGGKTMTAGFSGNPHRYVATERLAETPAPKADHVETQLHFGFDALTQATLALAYEQRTANLIALASLCAEFGRRETGEPFAAEAAERLGAGDQS